MRIFEVKSTILKKAYKKRDEWFLDEYSLNPYRLCEYNCVYCYIHGGKYGGRGGLAVKINAPEVLKTELSRASQRKLYGFIALGSATEPWMYSEERYMVTRRCLEVILRYRFPVHCLTKSPLILRDLDILSRIDVSAILPEDLREKPGHGVLITFSFSTLNNGLARIFEPNAPSPEERLEAIRRIRDEGFLCGIAFMPVLPYISDSELEEMAETARKLRVNYVFFSPLTLHGLGREIYFSVLKRHFPELVEKYRALYVKGFPPVWYNRLFYSCLLYTSPSPRDRG